MEAALGIADSGGLAALTVRGVARACEVTPMAIYRHVETVEGLEELAFRQAMRDMPAPEPTGPWKAQVISVWRVFRDMLLAHPGAAAIFAKRAMPTPEIIDATGRLFDVLEAAGFSGKQAFDLYDATFIYTLGSIRFEITRPADARRPLAAADEESPAKETLARYSEHMSNRDPDAQFEIGLAAILEGLSGKTG